MMMEGGKPVDDFIESGFLIWKGRILIDGGNSHSRIHPRTKYAEKKDCAI